MIDRAFGAAAAFLRSLVRSARSTRTAPGPALRALVLVWFVIAFGLWMVLRGPLILLRRRVNVIAITREGHRLECPLPDMIPMYLYLFGIWEPDLTAYLKRAIKRGDTVIDVGANHGAFALLAAGIVGGAGRVVAIEALPSMVQSLRANVQRNGFGCVEIVAAAASDREGTLTIYEGPFENLGRTTTLAGRGERAVATVRSAPLAALIDDATLRSARIIKIDVEGAEPAVLAGLADCISRLAPEVEILVELSPHWWPAGTPDPAAVLGPFIRAGFRVYELPNDYWPWRYAFPDRVTPPKPILEPLGAMRRRIDLVLSRRDLPAL